MRISWKSFFLSFGAAFVLFSIIMACICTDIFAGFVSSSVKEPSAHSLDFIEKRSMAKADIFYASDEDGLLDFALLVRVDRENEKLLVTHIDSEDLLARQGSLFYIRSLCKDHGIEELSAIFTSLTGYEVKGKSLLSVRDYVSHEAKYLDFLEVLPSIFKNTQDFGVVDCPLVKETEEGVSILNVESSLDAFRNFEIK